MDENKKEAVVDSSFMLCYILPDEQSDQVQKIFEQYKAGELTYMSLPLLPFEVTNGLYAAILAKRIDLTLAKTLLKHFLTLPIVTEYIDYIKALHFAHVHQLSVYDASYVVLAKQKNLPLLTLDKKLQKLSS